MATTQTIFRLDAVSGKPPATLFATPDTITDASTPASVMTVYDFDGATDEHMEWHTTVPSNYDGGGFTWSYKYAMDGADVDIVELELRIVKRADLDILTADLGIDTATPSAIQDTPAGTADKFNVTATGTLTHAAAGSPSKGDDVIIRITRDISAATNTDDLQLVSILILET